MSSSGVDAVNSGPILLRTYNDNSANNSYVLGRYDIPIPSNYVLITSTNGVIVPSDNITISNITINSITYLDGTVSISDNSILYPVANPPLSFIPVQPGDWLGVAMSASGQFQTALDNLGDIYRSIDYGVSWIVIFTNPNIWSGIAMSASGQYQAAFDNTGEIYRSIDYGATWPLNQNIPGLLSIAMSASGQFQTAVGSDIRYSIDYGVAWIPTGPTDTWISVAMSASGQYQTAVSLTKIYRSIDYGVAWTSVFTNPILLNNWESIAMSASGQYQTAFDNTGGIYRSINYGVAWTFNQTIASLSAIAISASGQFQTAVGSDIYYSIDYGVAWISTGLIDTYLSVAMSSSGQFQTAVSVLDIYTVKPTIAPVNTNNLFLIQQGVPSYPIAGQIYFDTDTHFYGYNGTNWKQLDN